MLTWIEIDRNVFRRNIGSLKKKVGSDVRLMPVIKSNAYGHGLLEIGRLCDNEDAVERVCVAGLNEALQLKRAGIKKPCLVLSFFELEQEAVREALTHAVSFPVYRIDQAAFLDEQAKKTAVKARVHLKIDTGTSRVGIKPEEAVLFFKALQKYVHIEIEGVYSHFSSSEESRSITATQQKIFKEALEELRAAGCVPVFRHIACSASTALYNYSHENAVRPGISIYGISPSDSAKKSLPLKPILSFYSKVIQTKTVEKGTAIGYGQTYIMPKRGMIATLPIGYFDGFDRGFSNKGFVLIKGTKCPVRGRVCMNLTMVEIPQSIARRVKAGETAVLIGRQGKKSITADDWARMLGTIHYEVVARLGSHIPRIVT